MTQVTRQQDHETKGQRVSRHVVGSRVVDRYLFGLVNRKETMGTVLERLAAFTVVAYRTGRGWCLSRLSFPCCDSAHEFRCAGSGGLDSVLCYHAAAGVRFRWLSQVLVNRRADHGMGGYTNDYNTSASLGAGRLKAEGVPSAAIQKVPHGSPNAIDLQRGAGAEALAGSAANGSKSD